MTDKIDFQLSLAKAWLDNGQEQLAKNIIAKLINDELGEG